MINFRDAHMNKFRTCTKLGVLELRVNPKLFNLTFVTLYACLKPPCQYLSPCTLLFKQRKRVLIRILFLSKFLSHFWLGCLAQNQCSVHFNFL